MTYDSDEHNEFQKQMLTLVAAYESRRLNGIPEQFHDLRNRMPDLLRDMAKHGYMDKNAFLFFELIIESQQQMLEALWNQVGSGLDTIGSQRDHLDFLTELVCKAGLITNPARPH